MKTGLDVYLSTCLVLRVVRASYTSDGITEKPSETSPNDAGRLHLVGYVPCF